MKEYTPHKHECELLLFKKKCPNKFKHCLHDECDHCEHFIIINFYDREETKMKEIIRFDGLGKGPK